MAYRTPTGQLLKSLRPEVYRQVVELLAEPREHVPYREIARICGMGGHTIKAVERAEAASIAERKARMLTQVRRVAERAWRTVEDKLDDANLAQAVICAGVATEKMLLLADQPTARLALDITPMNLVTSFQATTVKLVELAKQLPEVCKPDAIEVEAKVAAP